MRNKKQKQKHCRPLSHFENFIIFFFAVSESALISAFTSLVGVPVEIKSSVAGLKLIH